MNMGIGVMIVMMVMVMVMMIQTHVISSCDQILLTCYALMQQAEQCFGSTLACRYFRACK